MTATCPDRDINVTHKMAQISPAKHGGNSSHATLLMYIHAYPMHAVPHHVQKIKIVAWFIRMPIRSSNGPDGTTTRRSPPMMRRGDRLCSVNVRIFILVSAGGIGTPWPI